MKDDKVGASLSDALLEEFVVAGIVSNIGKENGRKYHKKKKL